MIGSSVSARDVVHAARRQNEWIAAEIAALAAMEREHGTAKATLVRALEDAWAHLTEALLPSLDAGALDHAARAIAMPQLGSAALAKRRADEERRAQERLAAIHADPRFTGREARKNELAIALAGVADHLPALEESTGVLEQEPRFFELIERGYGTERYQQGWWTFSYYRDWKHADLVVEKHGPAKGCADFAALRERYLEERVARDTFRAEQAKLEQEQRAIEGLVSDETRWREALQRLDDNLLASARADARAHLEALPDEHLARLAEGDATLTTAVARVSGVRAKHRYLDALLREHIIKPRHDLARMKAKNDRDRVKLMRPKHAGRSFPRADYERRFQDRVEKTARRRERYLEARRSIVEFHDYHRWDPSAIVWWDVMTDGRLDGDFIPEVEEFHREHARAQHASAAYDAGRDDLSTFSDVS